MHTSAQPIARRSVLGLAAAAGAALLGAPVARAVSTLSGSERAMLDALNADRATLGLPALVLTDANQNAARADVATLTTGSYTATSNPSSGNAYSAVRLVTTGVAMSDVGTIRLMQQVSTLAWNEQQWSSQGGVIKDTSAREMLLSPLATTVGIACGSRAGTYYTKNFYVTTVVINEDQPHPATRITGQRPASAVLAGFRCLLLDRWGAGASPYTNYSVQLYNAGYGTSMPQGEIYRAFDRLVEAGQFVGLPTGREFGPLKGGGFGQHFSQQSIYWSPATGGHNVKGAIRDRWAKQGWETGALGYPTSDEYAVRGGYGQGYQGGSIYWSPATGARIVKGAIRDAWAKLGWETSRFAFPTSEEYPVPGGVRQDFTGGSMTYTWATGKITQALK